MKNIWYLISFLFLLGACATETETQKGFELHGELYDAKTGVVMLSQMNPETMKLDSITAGEIVDGKFVIKGEVEQPTMYYLRLVTDYDFTDKDGNTKTYKAARTDVVILENAVMEYQTWVSDIGNSTVAGSEMHNKVLELVQANNDLYKLKKYSDNIMGYASFKKFKEKLPQSEVNVIVQEFQNATGEYNKERTKYITTLLNSDESLLVKILLLQTYGLKNKEQSEFAETFIPQVVAEYGEEHFCTRTLKGLLEKAKVKQMTSAGSEFINVKSNDLDGNVHELSSAVGEGKYVLLEFWASWCAPCVKEIPTMKKAYAKYHSKGFEIYGISIDKKEDDWRKKSKVENLPWINTRLLDDPKENAQVKYSVTAIPANFLVGPDGKIIERNLRGEALAKKLAELISK